MAKVFTPEEREEVKARIVEFVRLSGRKLFDNWQIKRVSVRPLFVVYLVRLRPVVMSGSLVAGISIRAGVSRMA